MSHDMRRYMNAVREATTGLKSEAEALRHDLEARYPGLDLWISIGPSGDLQLSQIVVPQRNSGIGTAVMQELTKFADRHGLTMTLTPDNSYGGSVARLKVFYRRFGFVPNKGRRKDYRFSNSMLRRPA
jgi:GNAT superfamily N-acetyltransferase